jgi:hypothetical protein
VEKNTVVGIRFDVRNSREGNGKQRRGTILIRETIQGLIRRDREILRFERRVEPPLHLIFLESEEKF